MNRSFRFALFPIILAGGFPSLSAFPEAGEFHRKVLNPDGTATGKPSRMKAGISGSPA